MKRSALFSGFGSAGNLWATQNITPSIEAVTGNFATFTNTVGRGSFYELLESVNLAVSQSRVSKFADTALMLQAHSPVTGVATHGRLSPTLEPSPWRASELGALSMSDVGVSIRDRLLELMTEVTAEDASAVVYDQTPQPVDWGRLRELREVAVHESEDLFEWYAQQEE